MRAYRWLRVETNRNGWLVWITHRLHPDYVFRTVEELNSFLLSAVWEFDHDDV